MARDAPARASGGPHCARRNRRDGNQGERAMSLYLGMVGLPNVGKSTLFNAMTQAGANVSNYPFCTIDRNVGIVEVPDPRLWKLNELLVPKECTPTTIQFTDIAGLVKGASQGEGLGNRFLGHIREVDAVVHVVRCFEDPEVALVYDTVDPARDITIVETEMALADLETVAAALAKREKQMRAEAHADLREHEALSRVRDALEHGDPVRGLGLSEEERDLLKSYNLLTAKPVVYVANNAEEAIGKPDPHVDVVRKLVGDDHVVAISARIEEEIAELPVGERGAFLEDLGLQETGLNQLVRACYALLNLITFYTVANDKLRAWQVVRGTKAPQAAGKIHTDMEEGFIKAEVAQYDDLVRHGSMAELSRHGLVRVEGKESEIHDGDVVRFLFHV